MTRPTINSINTAISSYYVEIVRGNGYFYFAGLDGSPVYHESIVPSVYSTVLGCMTLEGWVTHVETALADHYGCLSEVPHA